MPVTQQDIANRLQISRSLVARVLNNSPGAWASLELCDRIRQTAKEMNYRTHSTARALATGKTMQLAIAGTAAINTTSLEHLLQQQGFIDEASCHGYCVTALPATDDIRRPELFAEMLTERNWDGICIPSIHNWMQWLPVLNERNVPFILVGNPGRPDMPRVDHDNYALAYTSVEWLYAQGHRRIGFVNFMWPDRIPYIDVLHSGYRDAMNALCGFYNADFAPQEDIPHDTKANFVRANELTALIVRDYAGSIHWQISLQKESIRIPNDVTLMVHIPNSDMHMGIPGAACHVYDAYDLGSLAAEELLAQINGNREGQCNPVLLASRPPNWYFEKL